METKNTTKLTEDDIELLDQMRLFPMMDKSSQKRLRERIDARRVESKDFDEVFGGTLSGNYGQMQQESQRQSLLRTMTDAVLHPIDTAKGVVGEALLKQRNKTPEILIHPNVKLARIAEPWDFEKEDGKELLSIIRKLGAALRSVDYGSRLGMAAPQIGISKRIFICQGAVCINPSYTVPKMTDMEDILEGCYSIPDKQIWKTKRYKRIFAKWQSVDGSEREFKLKGLDATVFQHEYDHLEGRCSCDIGVLYTPEEHLKVTK